VEGHRFNLNHADLDPDQTCNFDAQIRVWILDWHQNNADPNADPSPSFAHFGKLGLIFYFYFTLLAD